MWPHKGLFMDNRCIITTSQVHAWSEKCFYCLYVEGVNKSMFFTLWNRDRILQTRILVRYPEAVNWKGPPPLLLEGWPVLLLQSSGFLWPDEAKGVQGVPWPRLSTWQMDTGLFLGQGRMPASCRMELPCHIICRRPPQSHIFSPRWRVEVASMPANLPHWTHEPKLPTQLSWVESTVSPNLDLTLMNLLYGFNQCPLPPPTPPPLRHRLLCPR